MRPHKPWYRKSRNAWYCEIDGKQIKLAEGKANRQEAYRELYRILAEEKGKLPDVAELTTAHICDLFLSYSQKHHKPTTYDWYKLFLPSFCDRYGTLKAMELKPFHVTQWLDASNWIVGKRCAVSCLKRAFNWSERQGLIPRNPLRTVQKPPASRRERILSAAERKDIYGAIRDQEFKDFVFALENTGSRPSEVAKVTAADVNLEHGIWIIHDHKTKKTGKPRIVYLNAAMLAQTRRLVEKTPTGPIFRGPRGGKPFTRNGLRCRFRRLRKKLPHLAGVISYTFRHTFITDALVRGVPVATVAELVGHKDVSMIEQHYGHLAQKTQYLREMAEKATQKE